ncbi:Ref family recombination enhancement nuclease [Leclercia adecarboxylata]|uniref:Ref family recombination enhancement nuclease n=1 Tax=Leclercia adecarboxylata TaxID=83655 RepID=UPI001CEF8570|nr:Ref family recombination enhancement nuclease [Leclercia adecarboxylata]
MGITNERYEKQLRAAERERERKKAKMADPAYQQRQKEKRQASAARQLERQQEKRREAALAPKAAPVAIVRKKATRGLKGRTPTADEKRVMTALARLSCVACALHGEDQPLISLHHIDGREKPGAHYRVLPLCKWHHQHAAPKEIRAIYPWLVPVHADGSCGGKTAFSALNASEEDLLAIAYERAGIVREAA